MINRKIVAVVVVVVVKGSFHFLTVSVAVYILSGVSHSDRSCVSGRIHSDLSLNILKKVYRIVMDNFVNL